MGLFKQYEKTKELELEKMNDRPKFYQGPALAFKDPELSKKIRMVEEKAKKKLQWKGDDDIETLCKMFTIFLTAPSGLVMEDSTPPQTLNNSPSKIEEKKEITEQQDNDEDESPQ
jgi:hypothetical protein